MTVFSADKFSSGDIAARAEYFEKGEGILLEDGQEPERSTGGEDYYHRPGADTLLTEYLGQGAQLMELGINPQDGDYAALMSGTNPRTGKSYVTERRQGELQRGTGLAGYSTSFNIDKTLSLVYAALPREQQVLFEKAVMEASRRTMEYAEGKGYFGYRLGAQGVERHAGKMMAAAYLHFTNRNQEPHLHVHVEIPNACLGADGKWRPLDGGEILNGKPNLQPSMTAISLMPWGVIFPSFPSISNPTSSIMACALPAFPAKPYWSFRLAALRYCKGWMRWVPVAPQLLRAWQNGAAREKKRSTLKPSAPNGANSSRTSTRSCNAAT